METQNEHSNMVTKLAKPGIDILTTMTEINIHCLHMAVGIAGEAGEIIDAIVVPFDRENIIEELGDIEFYMEGLRQGYGISREETTMNIKEDFGMKMGLFPYAKNRARWVVIESANILDFVKKHTIYNKTMDRSKIVKHLGLLEFNLSGLRYHFKLKRSQTLRHNINKLLKGTKDKKPRYGEDGYTDEAAQVRADKT